MSNDGATLYLSVKIKECNTATVSRRLLADKLSAGMTSPLSPDMPVPSGMGNSNRRLQAKALFGESGGAPLLGERGAQQEKLGTLSCKSLDVRASDAWCNANCNHVPQNCPATWCSCGSPTGSPTGTASTVFTSNQAVYANTEAGMVVALKESDGTTEWSLDTGDTITGLMVLNGDGSTLYVGSNTKLWAIRASDGTKLWESAPGATAIQSQPLISHDGTAIYVAYSSGEVSAFRATDATELWRTDMSLGKIHSVAPSSLIMSSDGAKIFGATRAGNVFALESSNGSQDWVVDLSGDFQGGIALSGDDSTAYVYRTTFEGTPSLLLCVPFPVQLPICLVPCPPIGRYTS